MDVLPNWRVDRHPDRAPRPAVEIVLAMDLKTDMFDVIHLAETRQEIPGFWCQQLAQ
jgi:hypothetical protein